MLESLFNSVTDLKVCNIIRNTPSQLFSCVEYCQIFKNSLYRIPLVTASENELLNLCSRFFFYSNQCLWTNFLIWKVYPSMVIDGKYIFVTYLWLSWQGKNLQQLETWNLQHHEIIVECKLLYLKCFHLTCYLVICLGKTSNSWYKQKEKTLSYLNNNYLSVWELEMLFPSLKEGKVAKISWCCD